MDSHTVAAVCNKPILAWLTCLFIPKQAGGQWETSTLSHLSWQITAHPPAQTETCSGGGERRPWETVQSVRLQAEQDSRAWCWISTLSQHLSVMRPVLMIIHYQAQRGTKIRSFHVTVTYHFIAASHWMLLPFGSGHCQTETHSNHYHTNILQIH